MTEPATMSLIQHLEELRRRLIVVVIAILIGAVVGFVVSGPVLDLLRRPLPEEYSTIYFTSPGGALSAQFKIAGFIGIALAIPIIFFETWRFVTPGLTSRERRIVWPLLIASMVLFSLGVVIGFYVIPYALNFLLGFARDGVEPLLTIDEYIGFVTTMMLAFGLVLQFPVILIGLARTGIVTHKRLSAARRSAIVAITLFAIVLTPGGDPISPLILGGTMYLLFELTLFFIRRTGR